MGESWLSGVAWGTWALALAIYLFGIASGWLIWGGRRSVPEENELPGAAVEEAASENAGAARPAPSKLAALESELRKARELLDSTGGESDSVAKELSDLDHAVKRANGRLRLVLRAVQRAISER